MNTTISTADSLHKMTTRPGINDEGTVLTDINDKLEWLTVMEETRVNTKRGQKPTCVMPGTLVRTPDGRYETYAPRDATPQQVGICTMRANELIRKDKQKERCRAVLEARKKARGEV